MPNARTRVRFRLEESVKKQAETIFARHGLTLAEAFRLFTEEVVFASTEFPWLPVFAICRRKIPFKPSSTLQSELGAVKKRLSLFLE